MTINRLRAKMAKMREEHEEAEIEGGELNLVPYLDIVTNVIMFLMMTTTFAAALANINVSSPTIDPGGGGGPPPTEEPLNLTVSISDKGFTIATSGGVLGSDGNIGGPIPTVPKKGPDYDYTKLAGILGDIKAKVEGAENETKAIINANPEIKYQILVSTMDAIRKSPTSKELFPDVVLSAGVQ